MKRDDHEQLQATLNGQLACVRAVFEQLRGTMLRTDDLDERALVECERIDAALAGISDYVGDLRVR